TKEFFLDLVRYDRSKTPRKETILARLRQAVYKSRYDGIDVDNISSNWLYPVIFELARTRQSFHGVPDLHHQLQHLATKPQLEEALSFLEAKGYLSKDAEGLYRQKDIRFVTKDDVRKIDSQRNHLHFLEMAKHRLNESV